VILRLSPNKFNLFIIVVIGLVILFFLLDNLWARFLSFEMSTLMIFLS